MTSVSAPQRAVITGVSRGIGRATALAFAAQGARVAGIHKDEDPDITRALQDEIAAAGGRALIKVGDVRDVTAVDSLADDAATRWGGIDVWVNNAARLLVHPFLSMTDDDWRDLIESNLLGYVRGARAAARHMVTAGSGAIVNVSSAVDAFPPAEMVGYVTAKGGIGGLTRSLAVELGPLGVRVVSIAPGATETPLNDASWSAEVRTTYRSRIPLGHIADAEEIADAIVAVASSSARYITGQTILVDGGLTLNGSVGHARN